MSLYKSTYTLLFIFISFSITYGQETKLPFESKIADLGDLQLEYMDFGGEGIPFIWVQDSHNYFEGEYFDPTYFPFFEAIAQKARVLAPLKRGFGKSTDTKWGYDVATLAEDLIRFMDALGIKKAVLFGRMPANQEMTFIAEHHPERLAGLIYWGNPVLLVGCSDPDESILFENWAAFAPDFEKEKEKRIVMSRAFWRPDFIQNSSSNINIPTLRIINEEFDLTSMMRRNVETGRIERLAKSNLPGYEEETRILKELVEDSLRYSSLKKHLEECDPSIPIDIGMKRTFGEKLITVHEQDLDLDFDSDDFLLGFLPPIKAFLNTLDNK